MFQVMNGLASQLWGYLKEKNPTLRSYGNPQHDELKDKGVDIFLINNTFCSFDYYITEQNFTVITVLGPRHFYRKRQYWSIIGKIDTCRMAENNIFHYRYLLNCE